MWIASLLLFALQSPAEAPESAPSSGAEERSLELRYRVRILDPADETVEVELHARNLAAGRLGFPEQVGFATLPGPLLLEGPAAFDPAGDPVELLRETPFVWRLTEAHPELRIRWSVPLRHRREPLVAQANDRYEHPYLAADHGLLVAGTLFLVPLEEQPMTIRVRFELPLAWPVLAPWPEAEPGVFAPTKSLQLFDDLIAVGNWQPHILSNDAMEITIAFAPGEDHLGVSVVPKIMRIVQAENELFGRVPHERYLFLFGRTEDRGFGGSPKSGSMTLSVPKDAPPGITLEWLGHLVAHEYHHTWMRSIALLPPELRFYNEGFTDYFAYVTLVRLDQLSPERFAEELSQKLKVYDASARACEMSLADAGGAAFFRDQNAYHTVYAGGLLLAGLCDLLLREAESPTNLDRFAREFNEDPRWKADAAPTLEAFLLLLEAALGEERAKELRGLVHSHEPIDWVLAYRRVGVELTREERLAELELRANLDGTTVVDLDPFGTGARLGLALGDRIVELNGSHPEQATDVRSAWRQPLEGQRIRIVVEREGREVELEGPRPTETHYQVPVEPFQRLLQRQDRVGED